MDELRPERVGARIGRHLSQPLELACVEALRAAFTPEAVVPAALTVRAPIERNTAAGLTDYPLDYDQEWVLKCDLDLNDDARRASNDLGVRLINRVAGSGKSLIIVYRARRLWRVVADRKILVLTHNRPHIRDLRANYEVLSKGDAGVEDLPELVPLPEAEPRKDVQPMGKERQHGLVAEVWAKHFADTAVTQGMLESELDRFKDRTITKRAEYLAAATDLGDWFGFEVGQPQREPLEDSPGGRRFPVRSLLDGRTFESLSVDIGVGDPALEEPEILQTPDSLAFADIDPGALPTYPVTQHIAGKVHAYTRPHAGAEDTRLLNFDALFDRGLKKLEDRLTEESSLSVSITQSARAHLVAQCSDHEEGARGFKHRIELLLATPVLGAAREAANGGGTILVDLTDEGISVTL